jgi:hypothetical protein
LPPFAARQIAKLLEGNEVTGAGDGNRTEQPIELAMFSADFTELPVLVTPQDVNLQ